MALRISAFESKELQATLMLLKNMPKELSKQIRKATKNAATPIWQEEIRGRVSTRLESRVLGSTATVAVSNSNVRLKSATKGRALSGGLKPPQMAHSAEFGADQNFTRSYSATSRKGKQYTVKNRHTRRQFRPRNMKGYVAYPAAAKSIPRLASLWVQTTVKTFYESFEGK